MSANKSPDKGVCANSHRGEVALDWGGVSYALIPSYRNLAAVEEALGCGFLELAEKLEARSLRVAELAAVFSCIAEPELSDEQAGQMIMEIGVNVACRGFSSFLVAALFPHLSSAQSGEGG